MGQRTNTLAVVSVVGGIASYLGFVCVGALVAIICGHMARTEIRKTGEDGDGLAVVGLVLGYSHIILTMVAIAVWLFFFGGLMVLGLAAGAHQ